MKIKEIAVYFKKAGVSVRPKALQSVQEHIAGIDEALKAQEGDVEMRDENDMVASNDSSSTIESEKILDYVVKKFEELKTYGGNTNDKFLEPITVQQIFKTFDANELNKLRTGGAKAQAQTNGSKQFHNFIKTEEVKMKEEKEKEIKDPNIEVLRKKFIVLDSFKDIPRPRILGKHVLYDNGKEKSLLSEANSRINYYQTRMKYLEDLILQSNNFERAKLNVGTYSEKSTATCLNRINAVLGSSGKICCLGIIVIGEDNNLHLEDDTMRVRLNLTKANSDMQSYFNEGNIVVVEGEYKGNAFVVDFMCHPPLPGKVNNKEMAANDSYGAYSYIRNEIMSDITAVEDNVLAPKKTAEENEKPFNENEAIIVISNLCLDDASSIESLDQIFQGYEPLTYVTTFVLCGEFISNKKVDSIDFDGIKFNFEELAN